MATRKQVEQAQKSGKGFNLHFHKECYICRNSDYGAMFLVKVPEGVCLCMDCSINKNVPDNELGGRMLYCMGKGFIYEDETPKA